VSLTLPQAHDGCSALCVALRLTGTPEPRIGVRNKKCGVNFTSQNAQLRGIKCDWSRYAFLSLCSPPDCVLEWRAGRR
jgi:hypothetical protein